MNDDVMENLSIEPLEKIHSELCSDIEYLQVEANYIAIHVEKKLQQEIINIDTIKN